MPTLKGSPKVFELCQNYPNPFNPSTSIHYKLAKPGHVTLKVFDVLGREIAKLVDGYVDQGEQSVIFDASRLSSGLYFYELQTGSYRSIKKMLLMK